MDKGVADIVYNVLGNALYDSASNDKERLLKAIVVQVYKMNKNLDKIMDYMGVDKCD